MPPRWIGNAAAERQCETGKGACQQQQGRPGNHQRRPELGRGAQPQNPVATTHGQGLPPLQFTRLAPLRVGYRICDKQCVGRVSRGTILYVQVKRRVDFTAQPGHQVDYAERDIHKTDNLFAPGDDGFRHTSRSVDRQLRAY